jgi:hypothetical protein
VLVRPRASGHLPVAERTDFLDLSLRVSVDNAVYQPNL